MVCLKKQSVRGEDKSGADKDCVFQFECRDQREDAPLRIHIIDVHVALNKQVQGFY